VTDSLPVTLCISTRNAGALLAGCIESCREWVSEVVVVDMESEDDTLAVAERYGAKVVKVPAAGWAEPGRQSGLDAATCPWVLVLDADERATPGIRRLVERCVAAADLDGMWLPRQNFQFGRWVRHSGIWPDWQLRLFRRESTRWPAVWTHAGPEVSGRVERAPARLDNAIVHRSFASVHEWVVAANRYTDHEADRLTKAGVRPTLRQMLVVPLARFGELYLKRQGFRSGRYGLTVALLSLCYWLIAGAKLWERQGGPVRHGVADPDRACTSG
jgi:glycosyltransferase involved in cell wall biosynthesis